MNKFSFFRRMYSSITCKKYNTMINQTSWYAIFYLAILEISFTVIISILATKNFINSPFIDIYKYIRDFLSDFFYNAISMTFDTILILSIFAYLYQIIRKNKKKYSRFFCLATYSSTLAMIIKYIVLINAYNQSINVKYFRYIYIVIVLVYFLINYKNAINENN